MTPTVRRSWLVGCGIAIALAGCVGAVRRDVESDRPEDRGRQESAEVKVHLNPDEGRIANGRDAAARGEWANALGQFDAVYGNQSAKPELRAQALYQSALVHSNALNPRRDPVRATAAARQLIAEFPQSEWRDEAQALVESLDPAPPRP